MEKELQALIESPEFDRYQKALRARGFNPFDVLQVADMEIRHSNVLAWLLRPDGTHGIGDRFLHALVEHLAGRHDAPALRRLSGFDDKGNVEVRREDYHEGLYADITIGFKTERVLLIIENKVVGWYPDAEKQARANREALRKKYEGQYDHFRGVLLTTSSSPEERDAERDTRDIIRLSWDDVHGIIRSLLNDRENWADGHVRAFVKHYLDVIEERLITAGDDLAERLRRDHQEIFERLQNDPALLGKVPEPHRATVQRWMEYFEGRPRELREKAAEYLTVKQRVGAGIKRTGGRGSGRHWSWLYLREMPPSVNELGIGDCAWWWFTFGLRSVTVELGSPWEKDPQNPRMQEVWSFLQAMPIDPDRPKRYPMEMEHRVIYRHSLLQDAELSGPFEESVKLLHSRLDEFFGSDGDYGRIERYFRCLAFDPRGPQEPADGSTAP
ncbi:MAG: PD-(D/E)XK nuclease family protein [Acidobacteria bacterium]|nr:PD-(D/E)XK nuclease family protein [Acidobacteriota bacterium]